MWKAGWATTLPAGSCGRHVAAVLDHEVFAALDR
jgi:hypothetical protein